MKEAPAKNIQISLRIEDQKTLKKLTNSGNTMPSWVLGEAIAAKIEKGRRHIEINLSDLFIAHQV